jgi:hypothetical protein
VTETGRYHGGLVFLGNDLIELDGFCRIAAATLEDYGHPVERQSIQAGRAGRVTASRFAVTLGVTQTVQDGGFNVGTSAANMFDDAAYRDAADMRVTITLTPADPNEDIDRCELLLVVMLFRMVEAYRPDQVEWLDPKAILATHAFLSAFDNLSPRRVRGRQEVVDLGGRFAPVEETAHRLHHRLTGTEPLFEDEGPVELSDEDRLAWALRTEPHPQEFDADAETQSDVRRLAIWGMTGVLATVSAPVAVSMAAVNLIRGEDFRLNTQALALTAGLTTLHGSGALAHAMSYMPM